MSDTRTVNSVQARKSLLKAFKKQRPVFLWGPPGIGKSELVADLTEELGGAMIDLRLGQMEPTDIRGIPFYNKDLGKMDWAEPIDLPDEEFAGQYPIRHRSRLKETCRQNKTARSSCRSKTQE